MFYSFKHLPLVNVAHQYSLGASAVPGTVQDGDEAMMNKMGSPLPASARPPLQCEPGSSMRRRVSRRRRSWLSPAPDGPHSGLRALRLQQHSGIAPQEDDTERWKRIGASRSSFPGIHTRGFLLFPHFQEAGQRFVSEPATGREGGIT